MLSGKNQVDAKDAVLPGNHRKLAFNLAADLFLRLCQTGLKWTVSGLPAAIYQKDGRAYLCWTIMPELSCVIEYDPAVESEEDMLRMAESVPANQSQTGNP